MNRIYRVIWSALHHTFVAVSELTKACGKRASGNVSSGAAIRRVGALAALLAATMAVCYISPGYANPVGPVVISGSASIVSNGNTMTVTNTPSAILNWQQFNIGAGQTTQFVQQSAQSTVLNRVVGQDPSLILGALRSNGQVFLLNQNGIMFGKGSVIDVAGLIASTTNITNADFLANRLNFNGTGTAALVNQGNIFTPSGGRVYLIANKVSNEGIITSPQGEVVLAAGNSVSLMDTVTPHVQVTVSAGGQAINLGQITAQGGGVNIYGALIQQQGMVSADSASVNAQGQIVLSATQKVDLAAGSVTTAVNSNGAGGAVHILGNQVNVAGAVDVSGTTGGGTILVGGDMHGQNPSVVNAQNTIVANTATLKADGGISSILDPQSSITGQGNGGKIIVWADNTTRVDGQVSAQGGALGGNGGFVETSGKQTLSVSTAAKVGAPKGAGGTWLLDPQALMVIGAAATPPATYVPLGGAASPFTAATAVSPSYITDSVLLAALQAGGNVILDTGVGPCAVIGTCNITINATATALTNFAPGVGTALTMNSADSIFILAPISSATSAFNMTLNHGVGSGTGSVQVTGAGAINLAGGALTVNNNNAVGMGSLNFVNAAASTVGTFDAASLNISGSSFTTTNAAAPQILISAVTLQDATSTFNNVVPIDISALNLIGGTLNGTGGLTVSNSFSQSAGTLGNTFSAIDITQAAGPLVVGSMGSTGTVNLTSTAGSISIANAQVTSGGNMTVNVGGNLSLAATTNWTALQAGGTQAINFTGSGIAHALSVQGGNNSLYSGASANIQSTGLQTISYNPIGGSTLDILVAGGSGLNNVNTAYVYANGVATTTIVCTLCATFNGANIQSSGGQTISASTITVNGGVGTANAVAGNGNYGSIQNASTTVAQTVTTTGAISVTGGTAPGLYNATYPNDSVGSDASIHSNGAQIISAGSIALIGGGNTNTQGGAFLTGKVSQNITTSGNLSMLGGLSNTGGQYGLGAPALIGEQTAANITLNIGGSLTMTGGSGTASPALIGSAQGAPIISITASNIVMTSGGSYSGIGVITGGSAGTLSMTATTGGISEDALSRINTAGLATHSITGTTLAGANAVTSFGATDTGAISLTNTAATLGLNAITSAGLTVNNTGAIAVNGAIAEGVNAAALTATGDVTQLAGGVITAQSLNATAGGAVALNATNMVGDISGSSGAAFGFNNGQGFRIISPGITATNGDVLLTATGAASDISANTLGVNFMAVNTSNGNVTLNAGRDVLLGNGLDGMYADIYANGAGKNVSITAGRNVLVDNFSYVTSSAGNVNLTATTGNVSIRSSVNTAGSWVGAGTGLTGVTGGATNGIGGVVTISALAGSVFAPAAGFGGDIGGGYITTGSGGTLLVSAKSGITLNNASNAVSSFGGSNASAGNILLTNIFAPFTLNALSNPVGSVSIDNTGGIVVAGATSSLTTFDLWAHSPITVNAGGSIAAGGALTMTAGAVGSTLAADVITLNGTVSGSTVILGGNSLVGVIPAGVTMNGVAVAATVVTAPVAPAVIASTAATLAANTSAAATSSLATSATSAATTGAAASATGKITYSLLPDAGVTADAAPVKLTYSDVKNAKDEVKKLEKEIEEKDKKSDKKGAVAEGKSEKSRAASAEVEVKKIELQVKKAEVRIVEADLEVQAAKQDVRASVRPEDKVRAEVRKEIAESKKVEAEVGKVEAEVRKAEVEAKQATTPVAKAAAETRKVEAEVKRAEVVVKKADIEVRKVEAEAKQADMEAKRDKTPEAIVGAETKQAAVAVKKADADIVKAEVAVKAAATPEAKAVAEVKKVEAEVSKAEAEVKQLQAEVKKAEVEAAPTAQAARAVVGAKVAETKSESRVAEAKPETKAETRVAESKPETKAAEAKPETKVTEAKAETRVAEAKSETKAETRGAEAKPEARTDTKVTDAKQETKPDAKVADAKQEARTEAKTASKVADAKREETKPSEVNSDAKQTVAVKKAELDTKVAEVEVKKAELEVKSAKGSEAVAQAKEKVAVAEVKQAHAEVKEEKAKAALAEDRASKSDKPAAKSEVAVAKAKVAEKEAKAEAKEAVVAASKAESPKAKESAEEHQLKSEAKLAEAEVKSAREEARAVKESGKSYESSDMKAVVQKRVEVAEAKVEAKQAEVAVKIAKLELKQAEAAVKEAKTPEQRASAEKQLQAKVEVTKDRESKAEGMKTRVQQKEVEAKVAKDDRDHKVIEVFGGVKLAETPRQQIQAAMTERHEFKTEALAPALQILAANPKAAALKSCAETGGDVCIRPTVATPAGMLADVMPKIQRLFTPPKESFLPGIQRKVAVVIGNNAYQDANIPSLNGAVNDADALGSMLKEKMGYEVQLVHNASRADIVRALNKVADETGSKDSVVVYYAGHGYQLDDTREGYWIPSDASTSSPDKWISTTDINHMLANIPARQVMMVSDSCFSGALVGDKSAGAVTSADPKVLLDKRSVIVMSSGGEEPVMDEGKEGHSIFAWHLMDKLAKVDQYKSGGEVFAAVKTGVLKDGAGIQTPQYGASDSAGHMKGGDYLFEVRKY